MTVDESICAKPSQDLTRQLCGDVLSLSQHAFHALLPAGQLQPKCVLKLGCVQA